MDFIMAVFTAISVSAIAVLLLTIMASAESVRDLLAWIFRSIQTPFEMFRDGSRVVLSKAWGYVKLAAGSLGISGEHWVQRLVGSILLAIAAALGLFVGTLGVIAGFEGPFGDSESSITEYLPVPVEVLMAIELAVSIFAFAFLLFDVLGVTHLTKFYSPEFLSTKPKWLKHILSAIFLVGTLSSIYLFAVSGLMRWSALFPGNTSGNAIASTTLDANEQLIYDPNESQAHESLKQSDIATTASYEDNDTSEYAASVKDIMVGIPTISGFSGAFAGVGLITTAGIVLVAPVFLITSVFFGIFWLIGHAGMQLVTVIYNTVLRFFDMFINIGDSIRRRLLGNRVAQVEPSQPQGQDNTAQHTQPQQVPVEEPIERQNIANENSTQETDDNNAHEAGHTEENSPQPEPLYSQQDLNWNPLAVETERNNV